MSKPIYVAYGDQRPLFAGQNLKYVLQHSIDFNLQSVLFLQSYYRNQFDWLKQNFNNDLLSAIQQTPHSQIIELDPKMITIHQPAKFSWANQNFVRIDPEYHDYDGSTLMQDYQPTGHEPIVYDSYNLTDQVISTSWINQLTSI